MTEKERKAAEESGLNVELMFPSKYLKAADLMGKDVAVVIESVKGEELQTTAGKTYKYVVSFKGKEKLLVLNKTNAKAIASALNEPKAAKWAGRQITLFPTTCDAFGKRADCIRVRP